VCMIDVSDEQFDLLTTQAMDELPQERIEGLQNLAIIFEDEPSEEQYTKLKLRGDQTLLGLYEGIPLTKRNNSYNLVIPDKITLFKKAICHRASTPAELKEEIKHTLWHEIAHYYGLDHDQIYKLEA
jgi:predicted Zn-dependent protease with MMP-like domain